MFVGAKSRLCNVNNPPILKNEHSFDPVECADCRYTRYDDDFANKCELSIDLVIEASQTLPLTS